MFKKYNETWIVELLFDDLVDWNTWFDQNRRLAPLGIGCLGAEEGDMQDARFESGWCSDALRTHPFSLLPMDTHSCAHSPTIPATHEHAFVGAFTQSHSYSLGRTQVSTTVRCTTRVAASTVAVADGTARPTEAMMHAAAL